MKPKKTKHLLVAAASLALPALPLHAAQVYLQEFTNAGSTNLSLTDYGWSVVVTESDNISAYSSTYTTQEQVIGVASGDYAYYAPKQDDSTTDAVLNNPALAITTAPGTIDIANLTSIGWDSSADNSDHAYRVTIQIGGTWYASAATLNDAVPDSGTTNFKALSYSPTSFATASNWLAIQNTTVGSAGTLSLGAAPVSDLSGSVTAFGLYLVAGVNNEANGDHVRWDNFEINAVPEPSSAVLGLVTLLGLASRRRRA